MVDQHIHCLVLELYVVDQNICCLVLELYVVYQNISQAGLHIYRILFVSSYDNECKMI